MMSKSENSRFRLDVQDYARAFFVFFFVSVQHNASKEKGSKKEDNKEEDKEGCKEAPLIFS
jgi:hypothetical protein